MVFWLIAIIIVALALICAYHVYSNESLGEGIACFLVVTVLGGLIGGLILGGIAAANRDSAVRVEVNREVFKVAEKSDFEAEDDVLEFVAEVDGKLVSKQIEPTDIHWETKNVKEVEVVVTDLVHDGLVPWGNIHTETEVYIR